MAVAAISALLAGCADGPGQVAADLAGSEPSGTVPTASAHSRADPSGSEPRGTTPAGPVPSRTDPVRLIGSWTATEVDGDAGGVLRLAPVDQGGLLWFGSCGPSMGSWRADTYGLFIADLSEISVAGPADCPHTAPWLGRVTAFRFEGDTPVLLDDRGRRLASLRPGAKPTPGPDLLPSLAEPPTVTAAAREALAPAAELPAGLSPASRDTLLGRWVPAADRSPGASAAYLELRGDGEWRGSDGCNGQRGRWVAGPEGALLATAGHSTLIGCDNVPLAAWLSRASRAGLDGDVLVLLSAQGKETGRLKRAG
ncbi:META domain-containing protein [Micromonospora avicenniae]|uniref:META domain-containing protein n=1 Tax=Micromonospora avicenniae TaxID=1198245 RepID=UPI0033265BEB